MDNQNITVPNMPTVSLPPGKNSTRRILFIVLGVIVFAEIIWAGINLTKPIPVASPIPEANLPVEEREKETIISLTATATASAYLVGENIAVGIEISSPKKTRGSDVIINFDPKKLTVQNSALPVIEGSIYSSYPVSKVDTRLGKITVSGISENTAVMANGLFGIIDFKAKASGQTTVSLEFTPGSTTDSNVIDSDTGEDVLQKVQNLEVIIQ